jgi:S-adenosylmethionine hydrolase
MPYEWMSFTTDYGLGDGFVAACKGVVARTAPTVRVIDVTHDVPPQDVRRGAVLLAQVVPYLPAAVHVAVVDPGVGTDRRGIAVLARGGILVGPDNGLLAPAAEVLGGIVAAYQLTVPDYWLAHVSATFHGRDIFAPVAANLANGLDPARLGPELDPATLVRLPEPHRSIEQGRVESDVLVVDRFGNVQLAATAGDVHAAGLALGTPLTVRAGSAVLSATLSTTFGEVAPGAAVVHVDSSDHLAVAINGGSAAAQLDVVPGATVVTVES